MRELKIENKIVLELPRLGVLTQVVELSQYEFIYVKNKIKKGSMLSLHEDKSRSWDKASLAVYYKGYKLGYLNQNITKIIKQHKNHNKIINVTIESVYNKKYLIMSGLEILIKIY